MFLVHRLPAWATTAADLVEGATIVTAANLVEALAADASTAAFWTEAHRR